MKKEDYIEKAKNNYIPADSVTRRNIDFIKTGAYSHERLGENGAALLFDLSEVINKHGASYSLINKTLIALDEGLYNKVIRMEVPRHPDNQTFHDQ